VAQEVGVSAKRLIFGVGEEMMAREGLSLQPQPWEDGQRAPSGPGFFEWWYFDAHLDDGSTAVVVFMTKSLLRRKDPLHPAVSITITPPGGEKLSVFQYYHAEEFKASPDSCDVRIAGNWVRGGLQHYELHASAGGLSADLVFDGIVLPWRPGTGKNYYDEDLTIYFGWLPAIPYGTASGSLTYQGKTVAVMGSAYHDHNWGNAALDHVLSHWYWGRAHLGDFTTIFVEMHASAAYGRQKIPVFLLAHHERILTGDGTPLRLQITDVMKHPSGREYPQKLDFRWQKPEGNVDLALREVKIIEATSLLSGMPAWQAGLLRLLINPYYFRFQAELTLDVDLGGVKESVRGPAIYELMLLR
jgi:hypothetical protein